MNDWVYEALRVFGYRRIDCEKRRIENGDASLDDRFEFERMVSKQYAKIHDKEDPSYNPRFNKPRNNSRAA